MHYGVALGGVVGLQNVVGLVGLGLWGSGWSGVVMLAIESKEEIMGSVPGTAT